MNLLDLYEMRDPRDAYQRDVYNSRVGMNRQSRADVTGEEEPSGVFTVVIDGKPWKTGSSNEMFALAGRIANKHTDKKVSVKWPTGELNTVRPQGVAEASDQSNAISQEQLNQMYANAKPMMFIKNTPVALVPLAKINQIGTPQQVQQVQQALGSVDQTSYTDEYKNKGYVVFQWNGTALDLYVASPEVVSQKYVKFSGQLPQDEKSRGKIPSLVALSKLGIDPSKVPFFVKKVPTQMVSAKQLGLENKTIQTSWGEQTVSPGGFMVREENGHIYTVAPDAQGLPIGYLPAQQGIAEGAEIMYAEELAEKVFDQSPNLQNEDDILTRGFQLAKKDPRIGGRVNAIFRTEDFPSDFVSYYRWIQHNHGISSGMNEQGMSEMWGNPYDDDKVDAINAATPPKISGTGTKPVVPAKNIAPAPRQANTLDHDAWDKFTRGVAEGYVPINIYKGPPIPAPEPKKVERDLPPKYDPKVHGEVHDLEWQRQQMEKRMYNVVRKSDGKVINPEPIKGYNAAEEFRYKQQVPYWDTGLEEISTLRFHVTGVDSNGKVVNSEPLLSMKDVDNFYKQHGIKQFVPTTRVTSTGGGVEEGKLAEAEVDSNGHSVDHADSGEYDYEGDQAKDQLNTIVRAARRLNGMLDDNENMPEWVQMKITNAADYIESNQEPELEEGERGRGRPPSNTQDNTPVTPGRVEKTATGIRHHADASRYGGTEPDNDEDDHLMSKSHISRLGKMTEPDIDEGEKVGNMDADAFDAAMARLKQLAGAGPMKTVYDPAKRVYRNVPVAVQPKK